MCDCLIIKSPVRNIELLHSFLFIRLMRLEVFFNPDKESHDHQREQRSRAATRFGFYSVDGMREREREAPLRLSVEAA